MVDDIKPHIIGITESWANNDITNAELIIIILFISYIIVQQEDVVSKKHQKYKTSCGLQFNYMVVKYMTMSLASHWFIVLQVIVLSRIIIHSAIMLSLISSSVFILLLYHLVMSLLTL